MDAISLVCATQLARRDIQDFILDDERGILLIESRNQIDSFYLSAGKKLPNSIKSVLEKGRILIRHEVTKQSILKL